MATTARQRAEVPIERLAVAAFTVPTEAAEIVQRWLVKCVAGRDAMDVPACGVSKTRLPAANP